MKIVAALAVGAFIVGCRDSQTPEEPKRSTPVDNGRPRSFTNTVGTTLRLIPAGVFSMGSPEFSSDAHQSESPPHQVTISKAFYIGETELTQHQWKAVMGTSPWAGKAAHSDWNGESPVNEGPNYPATYIAWDDASDYCRRLSEKEGRNYRLPSEAEWEYACRGGSANAYSFGDSESLLPNYAWFDMNAKLVGEDRAHLVRQKQSNGFGLCDMHGNVYEWCSDWYGENYYVNSPLVDPKGPASGGNRVARGGSWRRAASSSRSASRGSNSPSLRFSISGFRIVADCE